MDHFELFGLPIAPSVDRSQLAKKYFALQKENHPDFFTLATDEEKEQALQLSAAINKAFNIFQDKAKTLEYFLAIKGIIAADEKYELSPEFLMEMMEINEAMEEGNAADIKIQLDNYQDAIYNEIEPIIKGYNSDTSAGDLLKLKDYYYKKKYLKRILDRLGD